MKRILALAAAAPFLLSTAAAEPGYRRPEIRISDVDRFYQLYDSTGGRPSADQLQYYIDAGTDGFLTFAKMRSITGERIARSIEQQPQLYVEARKCADVLPAVKPRLAAALDRLKQLYAEAILPPVTVAVGRGKPVGTADQDGVMIGLEALCAVNFMNPDVEDRFVHVITHEYVHVQQARFRGEDPKENVLASALIEGSAEFIGELASGSVSYKHLAPAVKGRELELETAFLADVDNIAVGSAWLYNYPGTKELPADLGYWIGYRIAKAFYRNATDKRAALIEIIELRDPKALLRKSGWMPGMTFD